MKQRCIGVKSNNEGGVDLYVAEGIGKELKPLTTLTGEESIQLAKLIKQKCEVC